MQAERRTTIEARELRKRFADLDAVRGLTFDVHAGECFGFLGPNGAGKTSTMRMIGCTSPRSGGSLTILGLDAAHHARAIKRRMGVVPQDDNLDQYLSAAENLTLYGRYFDLHGAPLQARVQQLLQFVQLEDRAGTEVRSLSGGMRRRLLIARALINEPELVILDEPTTGLDPQARHLLWERLRLLKAQARTLLLCTHYMDEAEQLCDRLVIMESGQIIAEGAPDALIAEHVSREVLEIFAPEAVRLQVARETREQVVGVEELADRVLLFCERSDGLLPQLHQKYGGAARILARRSSLEDVFLKLTGRRLQEAP